MAGGWEKRKEKGVREMEERGQTGLMTLSVCVSGGEVWSVVMSDIKHTAAT